MKIKSTGAFDRQLQKLARKHYPIDLIKNCVTAIIERDNETLRKVKDHELEGSWKRYREFHPARIGKQGRQLDGWIVIYRVNKNEILLRLVTTGDHDIKGNHLINFFVKIKPALGKTPAVGANWWRNRGV